MKYKLLFIFITLFSNSLLSQNYLLGLDQLVALQKKSLSQVNDYLIAKNWSLYESTPESETSMAVTVWNYDIDYNDMAKAWVHLYTDKNANRLSYEFRNKAHYIKLKSTLNTYSYKLDKEQVNDGSIEMVYSNKHNVVVVRVSKESSYDQNEKYQFVIYSKLDYELNNIDLSSLKQDSEPENGEEVVIQDKIDFAENEITQDITGKWELFDVESELPDTITQDEMYIYENIILKFTKDESDATLELSDNGSYKFKIDDIVLTGYWNADDYGINFQNSYRTVLIDFSIVTRTGNAFFIKHKLNGQDYIKLYFKRKI